MDYFRILNFKSEPFSNSPDPGLFYPSAKQVACLQRIEMAIRLRRGLNVVLGAVGTGKTTLCRKLIQQISTGAGNELIELQLILDPSFSDSHEFLSVMAGYFGLTASEGGSAAACTDRQLKESIKNYLFAKGVEEGKIVALLIDEGQKLPDSCLEILREFLNYETNDCKLLQIVIFAQEEFREKIKQRANFANRINLCYHLLPLGFFETRRMVEYRISAASENGTGRVLFTWPALYALYRATGGNPRSINMLCHHVIMALIIQNRVKAGWFLVRANAVRLIPGHRRQLSPALAVLAVLLSVVLSFLAWSHNEPALKVVKPKEKPIIYVVNPSLAPVAFKPAQKALPAPTVLGHLSMREGANLWQVCLNIYGFVDPNLISTFARENPHIKNVHIIHIGEVITIPAIPAPESSITNKTWIEVDRANTLQEAYKLLSAHAGSGPDVMLFPFWSQSENMVFALLLKEHFPDRKTAQKVLSQLPSPMLLNARILDKWDKDTVFYHKL